MVSAKKLPTGERLLAVQMTRREYNKFRRLSDMLGIQEDALIRLAINGLMEKHAAKFYQDKHNITMQSLIPKVGTVAFRREFDI